MEAKLAVTNTLDICASGTTSKVSKKVSTHSPVSDTLLLTLSSMSFLWQLS